MNSKDALEAAVEALKQNYKEHGAGRPIEYAYGYMDALAVVKAELEKELAPSCCRVCRAMRQVYNKQ